MARTALALTLLLCLFRVPGQAVAQQEPIAALVATKSLLCVFGPGTVAEWGARGFSISHDAWKGDTHYDSINSKEGKARLIGNQGATDVLVLTSPEGLTFLEAIGTGNFSFTTVYASYCGAVGSFCAVMSRHMNLLGQPL